ncbi:MAG: histidine phosphatase family protein [Candidatus Saccharimonas sp.]
MSRTDVLLMRHGYDDHSYIDGKNDAPLTRRGIEMTRNEAAIIVPAIASRYVSGLDVRVSSKRRAIETAEILSDELTKYAAHFEVTVEDDLRELFQGEMLGLDTMSHKEKVCMLENGWEIFDKERVAGNDNYRFGTPDFSNIKYAAFNTFIREPYGESQNDFSRRIQKSFISTLAASAKTGRVPLILAHRGTIREVLNLAIAHNNGTYGVKQCPEVEMSGWRYCELFTTEIMDVEFSKSALAHIIRNE